MAFYMYVSISGEDKVLRFALDPSDGSLERLGEVAAPGRPAPMTASPDRQFIYVGRRDALEVSSYRLDPSEGQIELIGTAGLESDPCFISTDRAGRYLLSAYYNAGHAAVHAIGDDGAVTGPPVEWVATGTGAHCFQTDPTNRYGYVPHIAAGDGPNAIFQFRFDPDSGHITPNDDGAVTGPPVEWVATGTGAHCFQTDPTNRYGYVPHIAAGDGPNAIFQFRFDPDSGHITPNNPPRVSPERPDGPRHFCFHPNRDIIYVSNEQGCSVTSYNLDPATGGLSPFQTVTTLPRDFQERNSCSQIQITPNGRYVYAPNRGHDSIARYAVGDDGRLTPLGRTPSEAVPRAFGIDPTGSYLYSAGLESGKLAAFRIDNASGALERIGTYEVGRGPMWVLLVEV